MLDINGWYYLAAVIIAVVVGMVTRKLSAGILAGYVFLFLAVTVLSRTATEMRWKTVPFWSYSRPDLREQIIWNVVCFIPIGICVGALWRWRGIIAGVMISAVVELIQLVTMRGLFEFDDIIHNSVGTIIGVVIYMFISEL